MSRLAGPARLATVYLLVPIKPLRLAKSRLLGAADRTDEHAALVAAVACDTVLAARRAPGVTDVVVVTSDRELTRLLGAEGVEVVADAPEAGLNAALRHGDQSLRQRASVSRIGALQADLPALRAAELGAALDAAGANRAFCPDHQGTGTTLLLAEPGHPLSPRFGIESASAHANTEAKCLDGPWPTLRCDVDTEEDLERANRLGLGQRTSAQLASRSRSRSGN